MCSFRKLLSVHQNRKCIDNVPFCRDCAPCALPSLKDARWRKNTTPYLGAILFTVRNIKTRLTRSLTFHLKEINTLNPRTELTRLTLNDPTTEKNVSV